MVQSDMRPELDPDDTSGMLLKTMSGSNVGNTTSIDQDENDSSSTMLTRLSLDVPVSPLTLRNTHLDQRHHSPNN